METTTLTHQYCGINFVSLQQFYTDLLDLYDLDFQWSKRNWDVTSPDFELKPVVVSCWEGKHGIKSKAREIKCCKETKITVPPNKWRNIPF